ncbi:MAG: hypothetical protein WCJ64_09700 [Rhodospirillaceae bacterium]
MTTSASGFVNLVKKASLSKGAVGGKAKLLLAGHGSSSGLFSKAALSHCDGGIAGANALSFGIGSLWKGVGLGGIGLGIVIGELAPVIFLVAGAAAVYGCAKLVTRERKARRDQPPKGQPASEPVKTRTDQKERNKRLFSVLGVSVWKNT